MEQNIRYLIEQVKYKVETARKEEAYTLVFEKDRRKKYALSKYTPIRESKEILGNDFGNKETVWIFFGFAFGYMIDEIFEKCGSDIRVIIIEPSEKLLLDQIHKAQKEELLNKENVKIYTGYKRQEIEKLFRENIPSSEVNNFKIITRSSYLEFYAYYYSQVTKILDGIITNIIVHSNTFKRFGNLFLKNVICNRYGIQEGYDFEYHKNKYKNIPALVVSGGPSLSKNIKLIKEFKGIIFTGGRTLTPILQQGVKPDFLISMDPQDLAYKALRENANNDFPLITLHEGNAQVVAANRGPQYFLENDGFTKEFLGIKRSERLSMGGSVATACISAAQYMGCNPIIFIGQDLAYTGLKRHADECSSVYTTGRKNEVGELKDCARLGYKQVEGVLEEKVWTTNVLINYLRWIEGFIDHCSENEFINATEGGAQIRGAVNKTFKEVIDVFNTIDKPIIKHIKLDEKINIDKNIEDSINMLEKLEKVVGSAEKTAKQLVQEYTIYNGIREKKIMRILRQLDKIDDEIKSFDEKKNVVDYLFSTVYTELERNKKYKSSINDTKLKQDEKIAEYSYTMYRQLGEMIRDVIKLINEEMMSSGKG